MDLDIAVKVAAGICIVLSAAAFAVRHSTFRRYDVRSYKAPAGRDLAREMLRAGGLGRVPISGEGTSPRTLYSALAGKLYLDSEKADGEDAVYASQCAFEAAHALARKSGSRMIAPREIAVRAVNAMRFALWPLLLFGSVFASVPLLYAGSLCAVAAIVLQLAFLRTELNCARRARNVLRRRKLADERFVSAALPLCTAHALFMAAAPFETLSSILKGFLSISSRFIGQSQ